MKLIHGNCLEEMSSISDGSIDMILTDPPYGTTSCKWDSIIPLEPMWKQLERIIKPNGAIVMTASQPFTTKLISSNMKMFKYCWVWNKSNPSNISQSKRRPLKYHEDIVVFYRNQPIYNRQMIKRLGSGASVIKSYQDKKTSFKHGTSEHHKNKTVHEYDANRYDVKLKNPSTVIYFKSERCHPRLHPTQKPVPLMEYLVKTYTDEGEIVLDFCMGSGTTGVACINLGRDFVGIESNSEYCDIARKRISMGQLFVKRDNK